LFSSGFFYRKGTICEAIIQVVVAGVHVVAIVAGTAAVAEPVILEPRINRLRQPRESKKERDGIIPTREVWVNASKHLSRGPVNACRHGCCGIA